MAALSIVTFLSALAGTTLGQVTELVSPGFLSANPGSAAISADGRYVVFTTRNLFVRDRETAETENLTLLPENGGYCHAPSITPDGRFVTFTTDASTLVIGDTNGTRDVFLVDRLAHTTERVSISSSWRQGDGDSMSADMTPDGRYVVFDSDSANLVPGDDNGIADVFLRDRRTATTERVSISLSGRSPNGPSYLASISADARYVVFLSYATDLVAGATGEFEKVYLRDRLAGTTELVSLNMTGQTHWDTAWHAPSISADGRFVAFSWSVCDMCLRRLYVRDRAQGVTELVSVSSEGADGNRDSYNPCISADGRYIVFDSDATNLVLGVPPVVGDMYLRDRLNRTTERVSVDWRGRPGNAYSGNWLLSAPCRNRVSPDGRFVAFLSYATNLVPSGGSSNGEIYVRDRAHPDHPTLCSPGFSGVVDCPCANSPSSRDRGCDNSSASGGARLEIGGGEYLSSDSLFFTLSGATADALAVVLQAVRPNLGGAVFGQGVRCVGGTLTSLYVTATRRDGSVVVPNFDITSETVHQRAVAAGDPLLPWHTRWYMALYRDPIVLGGCPAPATFNTTPTREVLWLP
jgi:Tol biopolymer transport system component